MFHDAAATLAQLMRDGCVDRYAFFEVSGDIVREAVATGRPVRAYGEMVALLWEAGEVLAAIELETLWNELATEVPFSLYCAYRSDSVAGHEHADALQQVCDLHSGAVTLPPFETTWRFAAEVTAPADARRLLTETLRRAGHDGDLLDDARLVLSELAANAVVHAHSPFSVSILSRDSTLRILVRDDSQIVPTMHTGLVDASVRARNAAGHGAREPLGRRRPRPNGKDCVWARASAWPAFDATRGLWNSGRAPDEPCAPSTLGRDRKGVGNRLSLRRAVLSLAEGDGKSAWAFVASSTTLSRRLTRQWNEDTRARTRPWTDLSAHADQTVNEKALARTDTTGRRVLSRTPDQDGRYDERLRARTRPSTETLAHADQRSTKRSARTDTYVDETPLRRLTRWSNDALADGNRTAAVPARGATEVRQKHHDRGSPRAARSPSRPRRAAIPR